MGAHDLHQPRRRLSVGAEVGRQEDRLGAQTAGACGGHRRADAVAARLIACRRDDRARTAAGDHDRLAAQLGMAQQLDRNVERIRVEVGDARLAVAGGVIGRR